MVHVPGMCRLRFGVLTAQLAGAPLTPPAPPPHSHYPHTAQDRDSKFRLILIESRIHRLSRYYRQTQVLPPKWKYESSTASALVS